MSKKTLVTANYLDRKSPFPWLTRMPDEKPEESKRWEAIIATGVEFKEATVERKYGCLAVAHCDQVETYTAADMPRMGNEKFRNCYFLCGCFFDYETDEVIKTVAQLRLNPDRSMWYVPVSIPTAETVTDHEFEEVK